MASKNNNTIKPTVANSSLLWLRKLQERDNTNRVILVLLSVIVLTLLFNFIQAASIILVPITFAWLLYTLFYPLILFAKRFKIPPPISAAIVVGILVFGVICLIILVIEPASLWMRELPGILQQLRQKLGGLDGPLSDLKAVTDEIGQLSRLDGSEESAAIEVQIEEKTFIQNFLVGQLPALLTYVGISVFLTYFLLASSNQLLRKMVRLGPTLAAKRNLVITAQRIRKGVARYLATVTVINATLALVVILAMYLLGVPNPLLWGLLAGVLNFAPYVGPAITLGILTLVGISEFSNLSSAFAVPFTFFVITVLEGQLITPLIVGRSLALSPAGVFLSVVVWGWIWGMPGALMAVPIVASLKIISENIPSLENIARALERVK